MTGPRDWDKELAAIDKIMAKQGAGGPPAPAPAPRAPAGPGPASGGPVTRKAALATWLRVILGAVLAAGMTQWPYPHGCGFALFLYLAAAGAVVVAGLWSGVSSWHRRLGWAHTLSLGVMGWGVALLLREILPRVGYAKQTLAWMCP